MWLGLVPSHGGRNVSERSENCGLVSLHNARTQTRIDRDDIESAFIKQILDWSAAGES